MNCIIIDDDEISIKAVEQCIKKIGFLKLVRAFTDPIVALSFLSEHPKIYLIFLDIEMPEMSGMHFIKALKQNAPQIILITSHQEFAIEAFEYNVTDYVVKPIVYSRFFAAVSKAKKLVDKEIQLNSDEDSIFVKKDASIIRIKKSEILWVEALGDYVTLNTATEKFIVHSTMKSIEEKLPSKFFLRVHRSFIARIDKIDSIEDSAISYSNKLIPIGKSYKTEVFKRLNIF